MGELSGHGVAVDVPAGWDAHIIRRPEHGEVGATSNDGPPAPPGTKNFSVTHVSTVALRPNRADFGSDTVEQLGADDALIVIFEYEPASADTPLFANRGIPRPLDPDDFSPNVLQRTLPNQAGTQRFFSEGGRAFCLYVVLGSYARRHDIVPKVNSVLASTRIDPLIAPPQTAPPETAPVTTVLDVVESDSELRVLADLLPPTGLAAVLAGPAPVTFFAPSDDALAASGRLDELRQDPGLLSRTLMYHLVRDALPSDGFGAPRPVMTVEGEHVTVEGTTAGPTVNGMPLTRVDLRADNGMLHVLDGVLEPPPSPAPPSSDAPAAPEPAA